MLAGKGRETVLLISISFIFETSTESVTCPQGAVALQLLQDDEEIR